MKVYRDINEILLKRGKRYQIIAPELAEFFGSGGDYHFFYMYDDTIQCSGGNAWNWQLVDNVIEIRFQFDSGDAEPICIDYGVFKEVVELLGDSRGLEKA